MNSKPVSVMHTEISMIDANAFVLCSSSIDVSKIEEDSLKQETEALKSQLETVERLNDTLRFAIYVIPKKTITQ